MIAKTQNATQTLLAYKWDDIRVLLALSRAGTLKGAGAQLGVNASTVGRRLDALEAALGTRLFDRTPDGVLPTESVDQLLPLAHELEHAAADLSRAAEGFEREPEGVVRLTAPPGVAHLFVAPRIIELHRRYPKIQLEIDASVEYANLSRRDADIALRLARPTTGDLLAVKIGDDEPAIFGSEPYAKEIGVLRDPNRARWIDWGRDLAHIPAATWMAHHVDPETVVLRTSNMATQFEAARSGVGLILTTRVAGRAAGLQRVAVSRAVRATLKETPPDPVWLVGHRAQRNVPRIAAVWDFILHAARSFSET